jgi:elongation factor P
MDLETYEQVYLTEEQLGDAKNFLIDNLEAEILFFGDIPLGIALPNFVELTVTRSDPWVKGDTAAGNSKPITVETGYQLLAPPFVEEGEKIRIDTRTGDYVTRVKN